MGCATSSWASIFQQVKTERMYHAYPTTMAFIQNLLCDVGVFLLALIYAGWGPLAVSPLIASFTQCMYYIKVKMCQKCCLKVALESCMWWWNVPLVPQQTERKLWLNNLSLILNKCVLLNRFSLDLAREQRICLENYIPVLLQFSWWPSKIFKNTTYILPSLPHFPMFLFQPVFWLVIDWNRYVNFSYWPHFPDEL